MPVPFYHLTNDMKWKITRQSLLGSGSATKNWKLKSIFLSWHLCACVWDSKHIFINSSRHGNRNEMPYTRSDFILVSIVIVFYSLMITSNLICHMENVTVTLYLFLFPPFFLGKYMCNFVHQFEHQSIPNNNWNWLYCSYIIRSINCQVLKWV